MSAIEFRDVALSIGNHQVLADATIAIERGEFVGLLGANGAGKTTLMRAVLGLVLPNRGSVRVLGRPAVRGDADIGYVPQLQSTFAGVPLRAWDFVAAAAQGHRLGLPVVRGARRAEVDHVLDLIGAREFAQRPLETLSGGERQRLRLAQALLGRPRLLLLDEPLISLDPPHQHAVVELVKRLQSELELTVLFSSHELNPLLNALDRVLYLGSGQAALGTVDEVITGPVLSRLYGAEIEVLRLRERIFVMSGGHEVEHDMHRHHHDV